MSSLALYPLLIYYLQHILFFVILFIFIKKKIVPLLVQSRLEYILEKEKLEKDYQELCDVARDKKQNYQTNLVVLSSYGINLQKSTLFWQRRDIEYFNIKKRIRGIKILRAKLLEEYEVKQALKTKYIDVVIGQLSSINCSSDVFVDFCIANKKGSLHD